MMKQNKKYFKITRAHNKIQYELNIHREVDVYDDDNNDVIMSLFEIINIYQEKEK
jgi:hypothetical protein